MLIVLTFLERGQRNSNPGSSPCLGPLSTGVPPCELLPSFFASQGGKLFFFLYRTPRLNYSQRCFKKGFHLVPGLPSFFCFLLSCEKEKKNDKKKSMKDARVLIGIRSYLRALLVANEHVRGCCCARNSIACHVRCIKTSTFIRRCISKGCFRVS